MDLPKNSARNWVVGISIAVGVTVGVAVAAFYHPATDKEAVTLKYDNNTHFIGLCAGVKVTDDSDGLVALANCFGRVRGIVEGHDLAINIQSTKVQPLWCVGPMVQDYKLMSVIFNWNMNNPEKYIRYVKELPAPDAAAAIIVQAIQEAFPCKGNV